MIRKYDNYRIPVYPTHRTATYPKKIMDETVANATKAELVSGGNGIDNYQDATPFPIPQNGLEVIWNHITRYRGGSVQRNVGQVTPTAGDRKSTRLNSSHVRSSYAVVCLKKETN